MIGCSSVAPRWMAGSRTPLRRRQDLSPTGRLRSRTRSTVEETSGRRQPKQPSNTSQQPSGDVFRPRQSLLDPMSNRCDLTEECFLEEQQQQLQNQVFPISVFGRHIAGWINLFWVVTAYYLALNWYRHYRDNGSLFCPVKWRLLRATFGDWALLGVGEIALLAWAFLAVAHQRIILRGLLPGAGLPYYILRHVLQLTPIVGAIWVARWRSWPAFQCGAVVSHALVYGMKMHAYGSTCHYLHWSPAAIRKTHGYPENVTLGNFAMFLLFPTLLYETRYPRTRRIRWAYVADRAIGLLAILSLLYGTIDSTILPVLRKHPYETVQEQLDCLLRLMLPIAWAILLLFFLIFEYMLNLFAELTCFADRHFYDDWWNSLTHAEFARKWNIPVHRFLQHHVYRPCLERCRMGRVAASAIVFLLSSLLHELVMSSMLVARRQPPRMTFFCFQMMQIPLIWMQKRLGMARWPLASNLFFWMGIILGCTLLTLHYSH